MKEEVTIHCDTGPILRAVDEFNRRAQLNERNRACAQDFRDKTDDSDLSRCHLDPNDRCRIKIVPSRQLFNMILEMEE